MLNAKKESMQVVASRVRNVKQGDILLSLVILKQTVFAFQVNLEIIAMTVLKVVLQVQVYMEALNVFAVYQARFQTHLIVCQALNVMSVLLGNLPCYTGREQKTIAKLVQQLL